MRNIINIIGGNNNSDRPTCSLWKSLCGIKAIKSLQRVVSEITRAVVSVRAVGIHCQSYRSRFVLMVLLSLIISVPALESPLLMRTMIDNVYVAWDFGIFWMVCGVIIARKLCHLRFASQTLSKQMTRFNEETVFKLDWQYDSISLNCLDIINDVFLLISCLMKGGDYNGRYIGTWFTIAA